MAILESVRDENFGGRVLRSTVPVLVDYWSNGCAPCKALAPALEGLALKYGDKIKIVKINVDEEPLIPAKYRVRGLPTLQLFDSGMVVASKTGAMSGAQAEQFLADNLPK